MASKSSTAIDAEAEVVAAIQQMWQEFQSRLPGQLATLESAIADLFTNTLTPDERQQAHTIAHQLIGCLGAFGMRQAASLARQIEHTLKTSTIAVQSEAYDIPLRCLLPKDVDRLLVAGRCISGSHEAHSSYRVTPIAMATGQAAGVCAALAAAKNISVRKVPPALVQEVLQHQGASLST